MSRPERRDEAVIWHDVECGGYTADLGAWEQFARATPGGTLELGCGTGRVALRLARAGQAIVGLDTEPELLGALRARAAEDSLEVGTHRGDARDFDLGERFGLVAAPMQLIQLFDEDERRALLAASARHLLPGGRVGLAISAGRAEPWRAGPESPPPTPDVREHDGWVFSSLPVGVEVEDGGIAVRRLRQTVAPDGDLDEREHTIRLLDVSPETLEREGREHGLRPVARRGIPPTADHLGSVVVLMEAVE
jgi:SAM-dependent methyltransferase